jgi:predicted MFS family arabinose efflux permease
MPLSRSHAAPLSGPRSGGHRADIADRSAASAAPGLRDANDDVAAAREHAFRSHASAPQVDALLPRAMVWLFAVAAGLSVANVYYAQPLLDALASDFGISGAAVGIVVTATQIGCALALVLVVPLGDLVDRRHLLLVQLAGLALALLGVALAASSPWLLAGMLATGLLGTAMTQGLIAYAASVAGPTERGSVVGTAQAGVVIGLLLARSASGVVADLAGWRAVYGAAAGLALVLWLVLYRTLPKVERGRGTANGATLPGYGALIASTFTLIVRDRVLRTRGVLALLMFAAFNIFWTALVLPLSVPPFELSHAQIGAFGLLGAVGAVAASRAGRRADQGAGQRTTGVALATMLASWAALAGTNHSLWWLAIGIVLLDLGGQAIHVTNQSMIFNAQSGDTHSRTVAGYMLFYAAGSGLGGIASTWVYAFAGWMGVCVLGAAVTAVALAFWAATLRQKIDVRS